MSCGAMTALVERKNWERKKFEDESAKTTQALDMVDPREMSGPQEAAGKEILNCVPFPTSLSTEIPAWC
jgi:hypothetical protein